MASSGEDVEGRTNVALLLHRIRCTAWHCNLRTVWSVGDQWSSVSYPSGLRELTIELQGEVWKGSAVGFRQRVEREVVT